MGISGSNMAASNLLRIGGFTLIELLVVVAIIAVLISILLPSLSRSREKVKQTICMGNSRSIVQGLHFYAQDNDDLMPPAEISISGYAEGRYLWTWGVPTGADGDTYDTQLMQFSEALDEFWAMALGPDEPIRSRFFTAAQSIDTKWRSVTITANGTVTIAYAGGKKKLIKPPGTRP